MRLRHKIGAAMAAVTLTGLMTTGLFTWFRFAETFETESERRVLETTSALAAEWRGMADRAATAVAEAAHGTELRGLLTRVADGTLTRGDARLVNAAPRRLATHQLDFFQILDDQGVVLSNGHWPVFYGRVDPTGLEVVRGRQRGPSVHWRVVRGERVLAVESASPVVVGERTFHLVGGIALTTDRLSEMGLRLGSALYLQMNDGTRILPAGVTLQDTEHLRRARVTTRPELTFISGEAPVGAPASVSLLPVRHPEGQTLGEFVIRVSQERLNTLATDLRWAFLSVGALGAVVAFVVGFWIARRITRPIEELARAAARVGVGRSAGRLPEATPDEVGDLVRAFGRMTSDLDESRRELVRAERIAAWREIAQKLAHEIKNALSPIQISVETIQRSHRAGRADFEEILDESVHTVRDEVEGLRHLVNEFSQFARMPELKLRSGDLNAVVQHAATLHEKNDRGVVIERRLAPELPRMWLDAEALGRAVGNLVLNAVEASPPGRTVIVTTVAPDPNQFEVVVDDSGPGVPEDARDRVFEPYFTTKSGGTGLGLALAYKIVAEHGGRIEIGDRPGGGGRFRILFARTGDDARPGDPGATDGTPDRPAPSVEASEETPA